MRYVEALQQYAPDPSGPPAVFLAGGISGCPDWQATMVDLLREADLVLLNPRRANFPMGDPDAGVAQIVWEYNHLERAAAILFWFPEETLCPITLFELGAWSRSAKPLFVGCHPNYARAFDVRAQLGLARPDVIVGWSLELLAAQVRAWREMSVS